MAWIRLIGQITKSAAQTVLESLGSIKAQWKFFLSFWLYSTKATIFIKKSFVRCRKVITSASLHYFFCRRACIRYVCVGVFLWVCVCVRVCEWECDGKCGEQALLETRRRPFQTLFKGQGVERGENWISLVVAIFYNLQKLHFNFSAITNIKAAWHH